METGSEYPKKLHDKYRQKDGGEQVALEFSISSLQSLLHTKKPKYILELGGGLGTLTELILTQSDAKLDVVENNKWCVNQLQSNMSQFREFNLIDDYAKLKTNHEADFLVVDVNNGIYPISKLVKNSRNIHIIFIEGHHLAHRLSISRALIQIKKNQKLHDLRPYKGAKGCAFFEVSADDSFLHLKSKLTFLISYLPLYFSLSLIKVRSRLGKLLDSSGHIPGVKSLRKTWFGKIPWNF
jgi:phospholipid N-methyltransferase